MLVGCYCPQPAGGRAMPLFDRNGQSPDQPRYFVQRSGIMILDRFRKQSDTLVVAHRGLRTPVGGWTRCCEINSSFVLGSGKIRLKARHQITSKIDSVAPKCRGGMRRFSDPLMAFGGSLPRPDASIDRLVSPKGQYIAGFESFSG